MHKYLNREDVKEAIHAKDIDWSMCSSVVWQQWPQVDC